MSESKSIKWDDLDQNGLKKFFQQQSEPIPAKLDDPDEFEGEE